MFLAKTGMAGVNSFQDYCPVHDATAEGYAKGTCLGPEGDKKYTLFFGEGWQKSKWNRQFIANIIPDIKSKQPEYRILGECLSSLTIEGCLWDYIKQAQGSWKRDKPRVHHSGERFESRQEASNRAKQQEQDRSFQNRAHNRKTTKYKDRCKGVKALLKDTTLSSLQRKKWELLKDILDNLSNEAMSSEDTDYEDRDLPLVTAIPYYRRRIIGDLFEELDTAWKVLQRRQAHASGKRGVKCEAPAQSLAR
ncbi:hypothetical protein MPER_09691 [Moniliophthora perniciosa FA553]|nr:hypothetical protein MPER_09691 [Moniliophthora perniciosa FA553]